MKNKRNYLLDCLPFFVYTILIIILHINMQKIGDDITFIELFNQNGLHELIKVRYNYWSSRIIIEVIIVLLLKIDYIFFKILNIGMFILLPYSINKLFNDENNLELKWGICIVSLLIPAHCYGDAGWAATSINYLWTLVFGLIACIPIKKNFNNEKLTIYEKIFTIVSILIATNQEQMAGILAICYALTLGYNIIKKKKNKWIILNMILILISIIFIITCPGNKGRSIVETTQKFPAYETFTLIDKVQLGITSTMRFITLKGRVVFLATTMIIMFAVFATNKSKIFRIISIISFIGSIPLNVISRILLSDKLIFTKLIIELFNSKDLVINLFKYNNINIFLYYIMFGYYIIILVSIIISLYAIFKKTNKSIFAIILFMIGLISRIIMGFSPTVYASNERPTIFLYATFIILIIYIWKYLMKINKTENSIKIMIIFLSLICYIENFYNIITFFGSIKI